MKYLFKSYSTTLLVVFPIGNSITAQKIVIDTTLYSAGYGEYCESIKVCENVIPDSVYIKYNGVILDPELDERLKYRPICYDLGSDKSGELFGYKDFVLSIGKFQIEFSYPQYSYYLDLSELIGNEINLTNTKNKELIEIEWISIQVPNQEKRKFNISEDNEKLIKYLNNIEEGLIELQLSPTKYPNNNEMCGNVTHHFPIVKIAIN